MAETTKPLSERDYAQTLRGAFNDVDKSITTNGFLTGKIGHKIEMAIQTTNVANDTELYSFYDTNTLLYQIEVVYTDGTRETFLSAERIA